MDELIETTDEIESIEDLEEASALDFSEVPCSSFQELDILEDLNDRIAEIGWVTPTPVQSLCLPFTIKRRDVAGFAQTGTGKTAVFLITIANYLLKLETRKSAEGNKGTPYAIVLVPTRELAMQIDSDAQKLFEGLNIQSLAVYGGADFEKQAKAIRGGVDVIVATPGRLKDFYEKRILDFSNTKQFVCDEADRMFDMGFIEDVEYFLSKLDVATQKMLFSATTNDKVKELAFEYLENPEYVNVNPEEITPENIEQSGIICEAENKVKVMLALLREVDSNCSLIFTNTKLVADWLHYKLSNNGMDVDVITGDLPQNKRINLIQKIKTGKVKALIATDVASRGLHISGVTHVYNFDLPDEASNYIHRIGRTARAGAKGIAISLICEDYGHNLKDIIDMMGDQITFETKWYDSEWLKIEDKSGNPYKDPEYKGSVQLARNSKAQPYEGKGATKKDGFREARHPDEGKKRPIKRDVRPYEDRGMDREKKSGGQSEKSPSPRFNKGPDNDRGRMDDRKRRRPRKDRQEVTVSAVTPQPVPNSVGGMLKKIISVLFRRNKK